MVPLAAERFEERLRAELRREAEALRPAPDSWRRLRRRAQTDRRRRLATEALSLAALVAVAVVAWATLQGREAPPLDRAPAPTPSTAPAITDPAGAVRQNLRLTAVPATVRRGDVIQVAPADRCAPPAGAARPTVSVWVIDDTGRDLGAVRFPVNPDGTWLGAYRVSAGAARGEATVYAVCRPDGNLGSSAYARYNRGARITLTD